MPGWLNLDGYCPPELRERIAAARRSLAEALPAIIELGKELAAVMLDVEAVVACELDDHELLLDRWVGSRSLFDEIVDAADNLACASNEHIRSKPGWYIDMLVERLDDDRFSWVAGELRGAGREVPPTAREVERGYIVDPVTGVTIEVGS